MRLITRSIRSKLIFWISILFIFIGALIYIPLSRILPGEITSQILRRDVKITQYIANELKESLLVNDSLPLSLLLRDNLDKLEDAQYLFIQSREGDIISHTFDKGFPRGLVSLNTGLKYPYAVKEFLADGKRVYDIAVPILNGELGTLHLGVSLERSRTEIVEFSRINYYVAAIIFIGLGIGILIFMLLGLFLSNRIIKLKDFAARVGSGDLDGRVDVDSKDEIGSLAASFNEMVSNLKEKIEIIKRLSYSEERNRIAAEFHDGLAQDLANIIKRLELCERLFKIEPHAAFEELNALRENTKYILDRTRCTILDLKSTDDAGFNLLEGINNYIKDYRRLNNINVRLNASGPINSILLHKSKSIFCIITEALTNIGRHSLAQNVELNVTLDNGDDLNIDIKDDGQGFDVNDAFLNAPNRGKWGLANMRQRTNSLGGVFTVNSTSQKGTEIFIKVPLKNDVLEKTEEII